MKGLLKCNANLKVQNGMGIVTPQIIQIPITSIAFIVGLSVTLKNNVPNKISGCDIISITTKEDDIKKAFE